MVLGFYNGETQECLSDLKQWGHHIWDVSDVPVGSCHNICITSIAESFCGNADWNLRKIMWSIIGHNMPCS